MIQATHRQLGRILDAGTSVVAVDGLGAHVAELADGLVVPL